MNTKIKTKMTPIRYPGGKSNALKQLIPHLPSIFSEYREPFFGGGSVGLYLMQINKDAKFWINDFFYPVYCFWKVLYEEPANMMTFILNKRHVYLTDSNENVKRGIPSKNAENGRNLHTWCRERIKKSIIDKDEFHTACYWYILNKTSFSGMSMIGSYAPLAWNQNFTINCINNLLKISDLMHSVKSLKITNLDYSELLKDERRDTFYFLDPPYDIKDNLYGNNGDMHRNFNHEKFANDIKQCKLSKWMITYNNNPVIVERFKDYKQIPWELQYTMKSTKRAGQEGSKTSGKSGKIGKELLIINY